MKLYFSPGACSLVPHTCLHVAANKAGAKFESQLLNLKEGAQKTPEFLAINPRSQVPVLVQDGKVLTQVAAICGYIDALFPAAQLYSNDAWVKAQQQSMLAWMNNTVHPTFTRVFRPEKFIDGEANQAALRDANKKQFIDLLKEIDGLTTKASPFLFGEQFSPADAYALAFFRWGGNIGVDPSSLPNYFAYLERLTAWQPVADTMKREGIQLVTYVKPV